MGGSLFCQLIRVDSEQKSWPRLTGNQSDVACPNPCHTLRGPCRTLFFTFCAAKLLPRLTRNQSDVACPNPCHTLRGPCRTLFFFTFCAWWPDLCKMGLESAPRGSKIDPGASKIHPGGSQIDPRRLQNRPRRPPEAPAGPKVDQK